MAEEDLVLIEAFTLRLLRDCSCTRPPVPVNIIGMLDPERGVEIREVELGLEQGEYALVTGTWIIRIDPSFNPRSRRFITLREGFHIALASRALVLETSHAGALDWLANYFAACALMPEGWVREVAARVQRDRIINLAGIFQVSQAAMRIRLAQLGLPT